MTDKVDITGTQFRFVSDTKSSLRNSQLGGEHLELPVASQRQVSHPVAYWFRKHVRFLRGTAWWVNLLAFSAKKEESTTLPEVQWERSSQPVSINTILHVISLKSMFVQYIGNRQSLQDKIVIFWLILKISTQLNSIKNPLHVHYVWYLKQHHLETCRR